MESFTSTNIDISKFLEERARVEYKCVDPLLLRMLEEGIHADITFEAQGGTVKAHRSMLASASPVFQAMFQHDMKEHLTSTVHHLNMDIDSLRLFLLLLYITNERTKEMPELNAAVDKHFEELYDAAQNFQVVRRLKVVLIAALSRHLTPGNCWDYYHLTSVTSILSGYGAPEMCMQYVQKNFKEVMKSESTILEMRRNPELVHSCIMEALSAGLCCGKCTSGPEKTTLKRKIKALMFSTDRAKTDRG